MIQLMKKMNKKIHPKIIVHINKIYIRIFIMFKFTSFIFCKYLWSNFF